MSFPKRSPLKIREILETLARHEVGYLVVGGVAALLRGAPITTWDMDVVPEPSNDNLRRLAAALHELEAIYRDPAGRRIEPDLDRLRRFNVNLLRTRCGDLDVMRTIAPGWGYADLRQRSTSVALESMTVHVLGLDALIESKEAAGRDKDRAMLPILRETLRLGRAVGSE